MNNGIIGALVLAAGVVVARQIKVTKLRKIRKANEVKPSEDQQVRDFMNSVADKMEADLA